MNRKTPILLLRSININRGGVTKATMKRANMLSEHYKKVIILTTLFQRNHKEIVEKLYEKGELSRKVEVINFFEQIRATSKGKKWTRKVAHNIKEKGYFEYQVPEHPQKSYRYYKEGLYRKYKRFHKDNKLVFVDYMNENTQRIKRVEYDEHGNITRTRYMHSELNKACYDQYFDYNGNNVLSTHVNPNTNKPGFTLLIKKETKAYPFIYDLQEEWLESIIKDIKQPIIICEQRELDRLYINSDHPTLKKIAMTHSSHLLSPYNDPIKVSAPYIRLLNWMDQLDQLVLLTNEQKEDIEQYHGNSMKIKVIPHAYEQNITTKESKRAELCKNKVVAIARYAEDKRLDESIRAFRYVVEEIPNAKFHIYGNGPLEKELNNLIKELSLEKSVFLEGFTTNPKAEYQSAICSVMTSLREGFGMVITESMAEGTPVISYETKYGPKDIIEDGVNGYLVENGNRKALARKIIAVMTNKELRDKLSKNAIDVRESFNEEKYVAEWLNLINNL